MIWHYLIAIIYLLYIYIHFILYFEQDTKIFGPELLLASFVKVLQQMMNVMYGLSEKDMRVNVDKAMLVFEWNYLQV